MEFLDGSWKKEVSSWDALMREELLNQEAILEGAIHSIRNMGDVAFVIIRKREGLFQTVFVNEEVNFSIHDLKEGMTVKVKGIVNEEERAPHGRELRIREIQVLSAPAEPLPLEYFPGSQIKLPFPFPPKYSGARQIQDPGSPDKSVPRLSL